MCLLLLAFKARPDLPLILAANRDEFYDRPTAPSAWWPGGGILAGRDLKEGGTWLGVARRGRLAALTNIREPFRHAPDAPSRGGLVRAFLEGTLDAASHLASVDGAPYNGFNLVAFDGEHLAALSNRAEGVRLLGPGLHGLANGVLLCGWPKVKRGIEGLRRVLDQGDRPEEALLELLADRAPAPDNELPDTGVGREAERLLSPIFTITDVYGTRASTVVVFHADGRVTWAERSYDRAGRAGMEVRITFEREVS